MRMNKGLLLALFAATLLLTAICGAQAPQGGSGRGAALAGPKLAAPKAFPAPGTYPSTESVLLYSDDAGARVHYAFDGSNPTAASPIFNPDQLLFIAGLYDGARGLRAGYTIRAVATKEGNANSDIVTFLYTIDRRDRTAYVSSRAFRWRNSGGRLPKGVQ